jgi:hypothetical protein
VVAEPDLQSTHGQDDIARRRIEEALGDPGEDAHAADPIPPDSDGGQG